MKHFQVRDQSLQRRRTAGMVGYRRLDLVCEGRGVVLRR